LRLAGLLVAVAAGLLAAALAGASWASATMVVTHSAEGGELRDGRLILRGVSGRATWATNAGRSGVISVRRLHRRVFPARKPGAVPALGQAGHAEAARLGR
jgi:hypothetical protein